MEIDLNTIDLQRIQFKSINRSRGRISEIKDNIGNNLSGVLNSLNLNHNRLTTLPESIGNLRSLKELYLEDNQLTTLPESIGNLRNLKTLFLDNNRLTTLPESFGNLSELELLHLNGNQLTTLPKSFINLKNLERIYIHGNPMTVEYTYHDLKRMSVEEMVKKFSSNPEADAILNIWRKQLKKKGITYRWEQECDKRKPNSGRLKGMFKDLISGFSTFHGREINLSQLDEYLRTATARHICKNFASEFLKPDRRKACHNETSLLGEDWKDVNPLDLFMIQEGSVSYCFTPEE